MFKRNLDKLKIPDLYVLTPEKVLSQFKQESTLCDIRLKASQFYSVINLFLTPISDKNVNLEDVMRGKTWLVKFPKGVIKAYRTPDSISIPLNFKDIDESLEDDHHIDLSNMNLSELLKIFIESESAEAELISRIPNTKVKTKKKRYL